ncbi:uncharacterized protein LOC106530015 [Tachysurus ichikawai]
MAPGDVLACRRSVYRLLTLCFLVLFGFIMDCLRLMYDQVTLLNLRQMVSDTNTCNFHIKLFAEQRRIPHSPFKLCGSPGCVCWFTRRRRKRGTRAGIMVKLKKLSLVCGLVVEMRPSFSVPVVPPASRPPLIRTLWMRRWESRGVNCANLHHLKRVGSGELSAHSTGTCLDSITVNMGLVNARSIVNKTFILNDFYISHCLDFLFITETWLNDNDLSPVAEPDCQFLPV